MSSTVAFTILSQEAEGSLWVRLRDAAGAPVRLPRMLTRTVFLQAVAGRPGYYQLQPVNAAGELCAQPPQMITIPGVETPAVAAAAAIKPVRTQPPAAQQPGSVAWQPRPGAARPTGAPPRPTRAPPTPKRAAAPPVPAVPAGTRRATGRPPR